MNAELKRRVVHAFGKYVLNVPDKLLFAAGLAMPGRALLETIGRKTGRPRRTPVGDGLVDNQFWIVAEHGMQADYVRNLAKNPRVRLKLRHGILARWHSGTANVLPTCSRTMILASDSAGWPKSCLRAGRTRPSSGCWVRSC